MVAAFIAASGFFIATAICLCVLVLRYIANEDTSGAGLVLIGIMIILATWQLSLLKVYEKHMRKGE